MRRRRWGWTMVCCLLWMAGCATWEPGPVGPETDDARLAALVMERLAREGLANAGHGLGVSAREGVVTLYGRVSNDTDRLRADAVARSMPGVTSVVNRLHSR